MARGAAAGIHLHIHIPLMLLKLRLALPPDPLGRLRAQHLARRVRALGSAYELVAVPDLPPTEVLHYRRLADALLLPGEQLPLVLPPQVQVAAWLPDVDARVALSGPNACWKPGFPARIAAAHRVWAAQWQAQHPEHWVRVSAPETEQVGAAAAAAWDGWLLPAAHLALRHLLADAVAFPNLLSPPGFGALALLTQRDDHAARDLLGLLDDAATRAATQLARHLQAVLPAALRQDLGVQVRAAAGTGVGPSNAWHVKLVLPADEGLRHAASVLPAAADSAVVTAAVQPLLPR